MEIQGAWTWGPLKWFGAGLVIEELRCLMDMGKSKRIEDFD